MLATDTIQADSLADTLLESDRRYFTLEARRRFVDPGEACWLPGLTDNPAGCVFHIGFPGQRSTGVPSTPDWLEQVERLLISLHSPISRIYTPADTDFANQLERAGYERRLEIGYLRRGDAPDPPEQIRLRPIRTERDWADKRRLHSTSEAAPDGHRHSPADWVELERRRGAGGGIDWYLVEVEQQTCGALGLMQTGALTRMKNVFIHPQWRNRGVGGRLLDCVFSRVIGKSSAAVGVFGVADTLGERLYRSRGMVPVCSQFEWVRSL